MVLHNADIPLSEAKKRQFEVFYKEHYAMAHGYLSRMLANTDDAYDILLHSFELALARFDEYLTCHEPRYWFFGIVRNSASYFLRKRSRELRPERHSTLLSQQNIATHETPEAIALRAEGENLFARAIDALPPKYREVALLRFQGMSYKEIALTLDLTVAGVESRMRRAIVRLEPFYAEFKESLL